MKRNALICSRYSLGQSVWPVCSFSDGLATVGDEKRRFHNFCATCN